MYFTEMGQNVGGKEGVVYISTDMKESWQPVHEFATRVCLADG